MNSKFSATSTDFILSPPLTLFKFELVTSENVTEKILLRLDCFIGNVSGSNLG